jgi:hypothetical protein
MPTRIFTLASRAGKYAAKCAKELGIDYGEAIVSRHARLAD